MSSSTPHTILLEWGGARTLEEVPYKEEEAGGTITPGMLLQYSGDDVIAHAGTAQNRLFAVENPYDDDTSSAAIDSDYSSGDRVSMVYAIPGSLVYAWLGAGESSTAYTTFLGSNGDGTLKALTIDATTLASAVVGVAETTVTGGTADQRVKVRIH